MTIPHHFPLAAKLPVYCLDWLAEDVLVFAGGGGKGRTGVGNFIRAIHLPSSAKSAEDVAVAAEIKLSSDEDAPMAMAVDTSSDTLVLGVNEADEKKREGNEHLRMFRFERSESTAGDKKGTVSVTLNPSSNSPSLPLKDPAEGYVRRLLFSSDAQHLLTASTEGSYAVQSYPSLSPAFDATTDFEGEEIVDGDFSPDGTQVVVCTGRKLKVLGTYPNPAKAGSDDSEGEEKTNGEQAVNGASSSRLGHPPTWQTIQNPALGGEGGCEFRAVRFGKARRRPDRLAAAAAGGDKEGDDKISEKKSDAVASSSAPTPSSGSEGKLFTVVNAKRSSGGKSKKRKSFLSAWSLSTWDLLETRQLSEKPATVFAISPCGRYLAYGSSDLSVGVINARTLRPVMRILDAHSFPPTALTFSPDGGWLVSGSADNTLRVVRMPLTADEEGEMGGTTESLLERPWLLTAMLTLFILVLAVYIQRTIMSASSS